MSTFPFKPEVLVCTERSSCRNSDQMWRCGDVEMLSLPSEKWIQSVASLCRWVSASRFFVTCFCFVVRARSRGGVSLAAVSSAFTDADRHVWRMFNTFKPFTRRWNRELWAALQQYKATWSGPLPLPILVPVPILRLFKPITLTCTDPLTVVVSYLRLKQSDCSVTDRWWHHYDVIGFRLECNVSAWTLSLLSG